jgi:hypothetical protein
MYDPNERFVAVGLPHEESDRSAEIELHLLSSAIQGFASGAVLTILICDQFDRPIAGYEQYSRVFFFNGAAWAACEEAGLFFGAMRTVRRSEIPANYVLLAGPSSEAPEAVAAHLAAI